MHENLREKNINLFLLGDKIKLCLLVGLATPMTTNFGVMFVYEE